MFAGEMSTKAIQQHTRERQREDRARDDALTAFTAYHDEAQAIELKLGATDRWQKGDRDYIRIQKKLDEEDYDRSMDRLEGLVVARLFELTKMNMAGTGEYPQGLLPIVTHLLGRHQAAHSNRKGTTNAVNSRCACRYYV